MKLHDNFSFGPPLISFLHNMVARFLCPHIFTPITLSMKSEIKRVDLCVLKMFSSNFDDFLSSVSSPSYTSDIHKWHLSFGWKNIFFQVLFSHVQNNENLPQKKITHWSAFDDWSIDTSCWITSYNCNCPVQSFKPFALVCLRMSSSNFFNPSLRWHIIFKTCIRRGKKMAQLQAYICTHVYLKYLWHQQKEHLHMYDTETQWDWYEIEM